MIEFTNAIISKLSAEGMTPGTFDKEQGKAILSHCVAAHVLVPYFNQYAIQILSQWKFQEDTTQNDIKSLQ